jgi:hypothetical protein
MKLNVKMKFVKIQVLFLLTLSFVAKEAACDKKPEKKVREYR